MFCLYPHVGPAGDDDIRDAGGDLLLHQEAQVDGAEEQEAGVHPPALGWSPLRRVVTSAFLSIIPTKHFLV